MRGPNGVVVKDPDKAAQEPLGLVFETFLKFRTIAKIMRVLNHQGLDLPRRGRHGDLRWTRPTVSAIAKILKNPAYAGAFVYGRTRTVRREGTVPAKAPDRAGSRGAGRSVESPLGPTAGGYGVAHQCGARARAEAVPCSAGRAPVRLCRSRQSSSCRGLERRWEALLREVWMAEEALAQQASPPARSRLRRREARVSQHLRQIPDIAAISGSPYRRIPRLIVTIGLPTMWSRKNGGAVRPPVYSFAT
jgi:Recombinase